MPIVAWYMLSNESYMNRVIRDVLPTVVSCQLRLFGFWVSVLFLVRVPLCSPKKTNLWTNELVWAPLRAQSLQQTQDILELLERVVVGSPCLRHDAGLY